MHDTWNMCVQTINKATLCKNEGFILFSPCAVVSIGFEQQSYTCRESEPESCELCVAILSASPIAEGLPIPLLASTHSITAKGMAY